MHLINQKGILEGVRGWNREARHDGIAWSPDTTQILQFWDHSNSNRFVYPDQRMADSIILRPKRVFQWVLCLDKSYARSIVSGCLQAEGPSPLYQIELRTIFTPSLQLREELTRLVLHAGYSTYFAFGLNREEMRTATSGCENQQEEWKVVVADEKVHAPALHPRSDVRQFNFDAHTWCVEMPSGFVVVRRARRENGIVTQASVPTIQGNCVLQCAMYNFSHIFRSLPPHIVQRKSNIICANN